jgi:hypothetical protein
MIPCCSSCLRTVYLTEAAYIHILKQSITPQARYLIPRLAIQLRGQPRWNTVEADIIWMRAQAPNRALRAISIVERLVANRAIFLAGRRPRIHGTPAIRFDYFSCTSGRAIVYAHVVILRSREMSRWQPTRSGVGCDRVRSLNSALDESSRLLWSYGGDCDRVLCRVGLDVDTACR